MAKGKKTGGGSRKGKQNKSTLEIKKIVQSSVDFKQLTKRMAEVAMGVRVRKQTPEGAEIIYDELPNIPAAKLLYEYGFGKPKEVVELELGDNSAEIVSHFSSLVFSSGAGSATPND